MTLPAFGQADLSNCDREPIRVPGSIQPHGVLLALDPATLIVEQVAGDASALFDRPVGTILGTALAEILGAAGAARVAVLLAELTGGPATGGMEPSRPPALLEGLQARTGIQDGLIHVEDGVAILELLPRHAEGEEPLTLARAMIGRTRDARDPPAFHQAMADSVAAATGYDRVLVYRFLEDGSGSVVAEAKAEGLESYLGLHYPASDIPRQARELYLTTWLRLIPDVAYTPAPLHPIVNPRTGRLLDLGRSVLRSVSPLHLEYLANMGVRATMVMSLVVQGRLWGMIACHNGTPRLLDLGRRLACELFAQMVSLQLETRIEAARSGDRLRRREVGAALLKAAGREGLVAGLTEGRSSLLDLVEAGGALVWQGGVLGTAGTTPSPAQVAAIVARIAPLFENGLYVSEELNALDPSFRGLADIAAGILAVDLGGGLQILWFRPEQVRSLTWAGNPHKPVEAGPDGERVSPRRSFAAWRETVRLRGQRWTSVDKEAADALRLALRDVVLHHMDAVRRERERAARQQDVLLAELDHRVKNTLATIQALLTLSSRTADDLASFVTSFQQRLHAMARAHSRIAEARWEGVALGRLAEDQRTTLAPAAQAAWSNTGDEVVLTPQIGLALALAFHELSANALQHGALSRPEGRVTVDWSAADGHLTMVWRETGGPPVGRPGPAGFGRTLLERSLPHDVAGRVTLEFQPAGLVCTLTMPLGTQPASAPALPAAPPRGGRVLLVEDNALVAMEVEAVLSDAGHVLVGPAGRVADGLRLIATETFDAALLDVDLHGERVWPVADALVAMGRPFAFTTGFQGDIVLPERLAGVEVLGKPYREADLLALTDRLLARAREMKVAHPVDAG